MAGGFWRTSEGLEPLDGRGLWHAWDAVKELR